MNLNDEELVEIHNALAEQAGRRQTSPAALLRIVVDGVERATLNPVRASSVSFSTEEGAEIIEVKTADTGGDLLLATHLFAAHDDTHARPHTSSIRLEGGQVLSLSIRQRENAATGAAEWLVDFSYRETHLRRAARLFLLRLGLLKDATNSRAPLGFGLSPGTALACGAVLLCALAYLGYLGLRPSPPQETAQGRNEPASALSEQRGVPVRESAGAGGSGAGKVDENRPPQTLAAEGQGAAPAAKSKRPVRQARTQGRADAEGATVAGTPLDGRDAQDDAAPDGAREETEATRNGDPRQRGVALGGVRKIYLEMSGDGALDELRSRLFAELNSSGLVIAAANTDEADAALKVSVTQTRVAVKAPSTAGSGATPGDAVPAFETRVEISVRLVNAVGGVLWPRAGAGRGRRYSGVAAQIAPGVVRDLLAEVRAARAGSTRR